MYIFFRPDTDPSTVLSQYQCQQARAVTLLLTMVRSLLGSFERFSQVVCGRLRAELV